MYYIHSTKVSSRHLSTQQHPKLIVKNELVASYGNTLVSSVLGASTLQVAQQPSNFSSLNYYFDLRNLYHKSLSSSHFDIHFAEV